MNTAEIAVAADLVEVERVLAGCPLVQVGTRSPAGVLQFSVGPGTGCEARGDVPLDGYPVSLLVDDWGGSDAARRRLYDWLVAGTAWSLVRFDADSGDRVASRPTV